MAFASTISSASANPLSTSPSSMNISGPHISVLGRKLLSGLISGCMIGASSRMASSMVRQKGSSSHSISMRRRASSAISAVSAATATPTSSPTQRPRSDRTRRSLQPHAWMLLAELVASVQQAVKGSIAVTSGSSYLSMPTTPGSFSAAVVSMLLMIAWGYGLFSILMYTMS